MRIQLAAIICAMTMAVGPVFPNSFPEAEPILRDWIAKQSAIKTLQADFVQIRRLPTVRIPLKKAGRVWFDATSRFRWQVGEPPEFVAIGSKKELLLVDPKKSRARVLCEGEGSAGPLRFEGLAFPFSKSFEEFDSRFKILSFRSAADTVELVLSGKDSRSAANVTSLRIVFQRNTGVVNLFEITFRDGSQIATEMTQVVINPRITEDTFHYDLSGLNIDER
jgi:outer membrane lipoprotein-sorting protein